MYEFSKFILTLVRPFLTILGLFTLCDRVWNNQPVPEWFIAMVGGMLGWYFYDRSALHKKERENNKKEVKLQNDN